MLWNIKCDDILTFLKSKSMNNPTFLMNKIISRSVYDPTIIDAFCTTPDAGDVTSCECLCNREAYEFFACKYFCSYLVTNSGPPEVEKGREPCEMTMRIKTEGWKRKGYLYMSHHLVHRCILGRVFGRVLE